MAGDWIKMRIDLQSHPKIVRILSATESDKFRVIGGLHAVWSVFDTHSENGVLKGYTPELMDHIIGWEGFSRALMAVGWLVFDGAETLAMPEFYEHNGKSGKRRAEDQKRKRDARKQSDESPKESGQSADKKRTREEKRRILNTPLPPNGGGVPSETNYSQQFSRFWESWPASNRKVGKAKCFEKWKRLHLDGACDRIIAHVEAMKESEQWRSGFEPAPMTYINQRRWEDAGGIEQRKETPQEFARRMTA